ncbi:hypothetical protein [Streptomyces olivaceoviridis]|uniref:hypothetical protein n=1 Tax=Streptomyces olivaceoviridis TaxID=1921 RepID=UPI0036F629D1
MTEPTTDSPATSMCTYGEGQASGSGCIKHAGHDDAHLVTPGVPAERDLWRAPAAAPAGPAPATDRNTLRERIAKALAREDAHNAGYDHGFVSQYGVDPETDGFVDAVLVVLPAPDQQTAEVERWQRKYNAEHARHVAVVGALVTDRAAVRTEALREAADHLDALPLSDVEAGVRAALTAELRRLAGEVQQDEARAWQQEWDSRLNGADVSDLVEIKPAVPDREAQQDPAQDGETEAHPAEHRWAAELYDPVADEWVPGTRYAVRDRAVKHLEHARAIGPAWKDGTPTQRRLVRETTTYTIEDPAAVARSGRPDTDEEAR